MLIISKEYLCAFCRDVDSHSGIHCTAPCGWDPGLSLHQNRGVHLVQDSKETCLVPPNRVFPIAWTTLYTSMGYGSYLIWKDVGVHQHCRCPLGLYGAQLALNWAFTPIFFGAHNLKLALVESVILSGTVAATMVSWYPINKTATLLMVPYLMWLTLASSLSYCIWRDNPDKEE
ncbi:translocator protein [Acipenser oxyrinchus oxyrinchus]|uniref:Translocator protein n=1 Tax=Acipenser oxyrinchus oxyrinchus TaxID=40147 RepID=A0AAD8FNI9_ACIOX|nr:translocator protein [Acipenser oxyrinchus oxyrinchus]